MEAGWKARENYEFVRSEELLNKAKTLFEEQGDFHNVTECLNHLAYLRKTQSFVLAKEAEKFAAESLTLASNKSLDPTLSHRANASVLKYAGEFEKAESHVKSVIEGMKTNSAARGDMQADLALILMRRGQINNALKEIELASKELEEGWEAERMPHKMIWKVKLLLTWSLIDYNLGKIEEGKNKALEAKKLAEENDLKMRLEEANATLELFQ